MNLLQQVAKFIYKIADKSYKENYDKQEGNIMILNKMGQMNLFGNESMTTNYAKQSQTVGDKDSKVGKVQKNGSIFAGNMMTRQDEIAAKRVKADKASIKEILSTFTDQMEFDKQLETQTTEVESLRETVKSAKNEIAEIDKSEQELKAESGITDDSQEQKDLEIMRKQNNYLAGKGEALTDEEKERLGEMGELTDYQKIALDNDKVREKYQGEIDEAEKQIEANNRSVTAAKLEALKYSPMVETMKTVEKIQKNVSKEILGELVNDMKDHIDETQEEEKEKAEEIQEKKEEAEEKVEAKKETEEVIEPEVQKSIVENDSSVNMERELQSIMKRLSSEDLKGITVDAGV